MPNSSAPAPPAELAAEVLAAVWEAANAGSVGLVVTWSGDSPTVLFANAAAAGMFGYTVEEFLHVPAFDHFEPDTAAMLHEMRRRREEGAEVPNRFEVWVHRKDGARVPLEVLTSQVTIAGRLGNVSILHDVAPRHRAAEALAASEARFRNVVESAPDGVAILRGPTLVYLNPAGAQMLGFREPSEAIGRAIFELLHPDDAVVARERIEDMLRKQTRFAEPAQYRSRRVDGREITVEISSIPIEYEGGPAVLGFARDITERKAIQEKLVQADRLAAVGTLAAGIAHEINNPLAYVLLGLQYLEREVPKHVSDPARASEFVERLRDVRSGAERVGTIVRDLKTFARADEVQRGPVDLRSVMESALKIAENEIRHRANLVRDYVDVAPAFGNAARLEQVFLNLLVNAAHAVSERDPSRSEVCVRLRAGTNGTVVAEICDNGAGIPPDVAHRVFDPFFTTKPVGVGTGLGLPICRSIVESFGGTIELDSLVGSGTTARVVLPLHSRESHGAGAREPARPPSAPPEARRRILVVDDEPLVASLLSRMLSVKHDVSVATSGHDALRAIDATRFDAIVCDVMMPGMTGMDLYSTLRARDLDLARRIVFMTGGAFVPRVAEFLAKIDNPKLEKPFELSALERALRELEERPA